MNGFYRKKKMAQDKLKEQTKLYLVETVSIFRHRYIVEAKIGRAHV